MKNTSAFSRLNILTLLAAVSLLLNACSLPGYSTSTGESDSAHIWLDQPLTGYAIPPLPIVLIAHASRPGGGISQVIFQVNGVPVGAVQMDTGLEFVRAETTWNPSLPGMYTIQAQAITTGGLSVSDISNVCVSTENIAPSYGISDTCISSPQSPLVPAPSEETLPPSITPPVSATAPFVLTTTPFVPSATSFIPSATEFVPTPIPPTDMPVPPKPADTTPPAVGKISASAYDVYYQTGCGPNTFTVQAYVTDESGVGSVNLILNYVGKSLGANIPMTPIGGNMYQAAYDVGGQAYPVLSGANGQISIAVQAQDTLGNTGSGDGGVVNVSFCPG